MAEYIDREVAVLVMHEAKKQDMPLFNDGLMKGADIIISMTAADVKPVVHAHFYVDDGCAYCSNCRNNFKKAILKAVKFCPMCGAQIDGYGGHPDAGPPTPYDLLYEEGGWNLQ